MENKESRIEKLERLVNDGASLDDVISQSEHIISNIMLIDEGIRLQKAIRSYGGILSGSCPMILWVDPKLVRRLSIG